MPDHRPDPDTLWARVQEEEAQRTRGKLKIFCGATAGVGKAYAMLEAAHARHKERAVAQWVYEHCQIAGLGTTTLPSAEAWWKRMAGRCGPKTDLAAARWCASRCR